VAEGRIESCLTPQTMAAMQRAVPADKKGAGFQASSCSQLLSSGSRQLCPMVCLAGLLPEAPATHFFYSKHPSLLYSEC